MKQKEITKEIIEYIDTFDDSGAWHGEVNLVSWNGKEAKVDIRNWSEDHAKCSRGLSLTRETARMLGEILIRL